MTRLQKLILVILGILDVAVIALLASVVIQNLPPTPTMSPIVVQASPCTHRLVELFSAATSFADGIPIVAWDDQQLALSLRVVHPAATPPEDSAQHLWTALDTIAKIAPEGCPLPETVTIAINAHGESETHQFLVQLAGADIENWLAGNLTEEALATRARYRQTTAPQ